MGRYIQGYAKREARPTLIPRAPFHERLASSIGNWAAKRGIGELTRVYAAEPSRVAFTIYPPTGSITVSITADSLSFETKTSVAGPGYHAAILDLCDHVARDVGLKWLWDLPRGRSGDDTGYAVDRDSARLEETFVEQFIAQLRWLDQRDRSRNLNYAINLPEALLASGRPGEVTTPLGVTDPATLCASLALERDDQVKAAASFYPWWGEPSGEQFWRQSMLSMLWTEVVWRAPRNAYETFIQKAIFAAAERLRSLGAPPSSDVAAALADLRDAIEKDEPPISIGIGYRRGPVLFKLFSKWWIEAPGHFILDDENDTACLWFGDTAVRATSYTLTKKEPGQAASWGKHFDDAVEHDGKTHRFRVQQEVRRTDEGKAWFAMACCLRDEPSTAEMLLVSLTSGDDASHVQRLTEFASKVRYWPPQQPTRGDAN